MDRELALYYGKQYEQEAVIWALKHKDENNNPYFKFEYIQVASGDTHNTRIVSVAAPDIQTRDDDMFFQKGDGKIEFYIPFVDEVINGIIPLVEHLSRSPQHAFFSSDLPNTPEVQKLVKEILEHEKMLNEKRHQKSKYHHRSIMGVRLEKLKNILEGHNRNISGI